VSVEALDARARWMRISLGLKIVAIAGVSTALVSFILVFSFGREAEKMLRGELTTRGRMAALALANTSATHVFAQDMSGLQTLAAATLADVPGAAYVVVRDDRGMVLALAAQQALANARPTALPIGDIGLGTRVLERMVTVGGREMIDVVALISFRTKAEVQYLDPLGLTPTTGAGSAGVKHLGTVEIGFPYEDLTSQLAASGRASVSMAAVVFVACLLAMYPLARFTTKPLADLRRAALGIAEGDLRQNVTTARRDEVGDLGRSFARMVSELQSMLADLKDAASTLAQESDAMLAAATRQAAMATQQSASVAQMNASMREISQTSGAATDHADRVIAVTQSAEESSHVGEGIVVEAVGSTTHVEQHVSAIASRLGDLSGRVNQIGAIIGTVKDLALRSNVLALNAAIQAARSGETGASFSVIAREMRALAERSSATAGEVPKLLGEIVECSEAASSATQQGIDKARSTAALARRAGETIGNLANVCRESATAARQIAESSRQQATGVNEMMSALMQLSLTAEVNVKGSDEMRRVAERLKSVSGRLTGLAERYRS
jgi:methyl-accepting chemotaxis protein